MVPEMQKAAEMQGVGTNWAQYLPCVYFPSPRLSNLPSSLRRLLTKTAIGFDQRRFPEFVVKKEQ